MGIEVQKNITRHYLPTGLTMLFLLTVKANLVNELPRKMMSYYFYAANKVSESFVSLAVRMLLLL